jgi:hypothetical protein
VSTLLLTRAELGELWLPWFVHASDPSVQVTDILGEQEDAVQLRIRHIEDDRVWRALGEPHPSSPGHSHAKAIQDYESRYRGRAIAFSAPAWVAPEGPVLVDCCHRACAIYLLDPEILDASVHTFPEGYLSLLRGLRGWDP